MDTRALTKKIREKGTLLGKLLPDEAPEESIPFQDPNERHLVQEVSLKVWRQLVAGYRVAMGRTPTHPLRRSRVSLTPVDPRASPLWTAA